MKLDKEWKSNCCNKDVKVNGKTTKYYLCTECGLPCEAIREEK